METYNLLDSIAGLFFMLILVIPLAVIGALALVSKYYGAIGVLLSIFATIYLTRKGMHLKRKASNKSERRKAFWTKLSPIGMYIMLIAITPFLDYPTEIPKSEFTASAYSQVKENNKGFYFYSMVNGEKETKVVYKKDIKHLELYQTNEIKEFIYIPESGEHDYLGNKLTIFISDPINIDKELDYK